MASDSSQKRSYVAEPETFPERVVAMYRSSVTLAVFTFGVFLLAIGGVLIPYGLLNFGGANDVLAGMFGIWGATAMFASVAAYGLLWVNEWNDERSAYSFDE